LLIAGGIGVAPIGGCAKSLQYQHDTLRRPLDRVQFVWALRNPEFLESLKPFAVDAPEKLLSSMVKCSFNVSGKHEATEQVSKGRPDLDAIFAEMKEEGNDAHVAVLVCGPTPLISNCQRLCSKYNFDFYSEVFEF